MKQLLEEARELLHFVTCAVYFYRKQNYIEGNAFNIRLIKQGEQFFDYAEEIGNFKITKGATESETIDVPIDWSKSDDKDVPVDFDSIKVLIGRASDEY